MIDPEISAERAQAGGNVYEAVKAHADDIRKGGRRVAIASWTEGSRERMETILKDHDVAPLAAARDWPEFLSWDKAIAGLIVLGLAGLITMGVLQAGVPELRAALASLAGP